MKSKAIFPKLDQIENATFTSPIFFSATLVALHLTPVIWSETQSLKSRRVVACFFPISVYDEKNAHFVWHHFLNADIQALSSFYSMHNNLGKQHH